MNRHDIRPNIRWGLALIALAASAACATPGAQNRTPSTTKAEAVARGLYIVNAGGCHDCHTPWKMGPEGPEPDMSRALSGHPETMAVTTPPTLNGPWLSASSATNTAFAGPWGISYAANLTPDQNTGLGIWTEDMFVKAIRTGRHMGTSRPINPPMPWPVFRNYSDEDLKAIYSYLRSLKPFTNHVPDYLPPPTATASAEPASKDSRQ